MQVAVDGAHSVRVRVEGLEPSEIEVNTALGRQVFEIRIPEEALQRAVERAGRR